MPTTTTAARDEAAQSANVVAAHEAAEADRRNQVIVFVFAPRHPHAKKFEWEKTMLVGDAARAAAAEFQYQGGNPGLQTGGKEPRVLDNNKTLQGEGVKNGDHLELIDTGGGV